MPKFKTSSDVVIHRGVSGEPPIGLLAHKAYETEDKSEIAALRGSPSVEEVVEEKPKPKVENKAVEPEAGPVVEEQSAAKSTPSPTKKKGK